MPTAYNHLLKLYKLLLIQTYNEECKLEMENIIIPTGSWCSGTCLICSSPDSLKNCSLSIPLEDQPDTFGELLSSCFRVKLVGDQQMVDICDGCASRLREAVLFRKQIEIAAIRLKKLQCGKSTKKPRKPRIKANPFIEHDINIKYENDDSFHDFPTDDFHSESVNGSPSHSTSAPHVTVEVPKVEPNDNIGQSGPRECNTSENQKDKRVEWVDQPVVFKTEKYVAPSLQSSDTQCPICREDFDDFPKLRKHYNVHFHRYLCDFCARTFANRSNLSSHMANHGERFPCSKCKKTFSNRDSHKRHFNLIHLGIMSYSCRYCTERFSSNMQRIDHLEDAHKIMLGIHVCAQCGAKCYSAYKLEQHHRRVHLKERNVACPFCNRKYFNIGIMRNHMRVHSDERKYACDICHKAFKLKRHLRNHLNIHFNIRKYKCHICGQTFIQDASFRVHMKSRHKYNNSS